MQGVKKRFIAGAICQSCQAQDTVFVFKENNVEKLECVSCGFQMSQPEDKVQEQLRQDESVIGIFKPQ